MIRRCEAGQVLYIAARKALNTPAEFMAWDTYNQHCLHCEQCSGRVGSVTKPLPAVKQEKKDNG